MKLGFVHVFGPCDPANHGIALVPDRYAGLALSLFSFLIFKPNHRDKVNCTSMYTRFGFEVEDYSTTPLPPVPTDPHAWYSDYSSSLAVRFVANYPSIPAYSIDVAKIKAKYSSKPSDPCSAAFWSIIQMAYSQKQFCVGNSADDDQQQSVSSPDNASVLSADDDAEDDEVSQKKKASHKRKRLDDKHSNKTRRLHFHLF
jgi:hypothetical protein